MSVSLSLTDKQTFAALLNFLENVLTTTDSNGKLILDVIRGQDNKVAEPAVSNFVLMTFLHKERLATNTVTYTTPIGATTSTRQDLTPINYTIRLDVHGDSAADNTQIIMSMFRSDYATSFFKGVGYDVTPLWCRDPTQVPYLNGEQQIEQRWIMEVYLQCNPVLSMTGIESADTLSVNEFVDVDNNIN